MTGTVIFLGVFVAVIVAGWAWCRCRAVRARAREKAAARHPSRRVPGLPRDGEPLTDAELEEFTGILLRPVREPEASNDGSPPAGGQDSSSEEAR